MLTKMNFRSKKGLSLAVALTICLFLVLVTGGITTVAMLQHKETGSNMNSRQAYISAKSGLDTMQDALEEKAITNLPAFAGGTGYYVMYYSGDQLLNSGLLNSEDEVENFFASLPEGTEIVGGEGTYFKITNAGGKKYNVTALNTTGKYNDDLTLNRGDLSFDMVMIKKYVFSLKPTTPAPTGSSLPTPPTGTIPLPPPPRSHSSRFMLVGQQTCLNEATKPGQGNTSTGRVLNQYYIEQEGGNGNAVFDGVCYIPYNENISGDNIQNEYNYTYFPLVYDKMVKLTSESFRVSINVYDEGIYLVGSASGDIADQFINENGKKFGDVSYLSQNGAYAQEFRCNFLCIKENFVTRRQNGRDNTNAYDPIVRYCGSQNLGYVVVNIPVEPVTFFTVDESGKIKEEFSIDPGYYKLPSGSHINIKDSWYENGSLRTLTAAEQAEWEKFNLYNTIISYTTGGSAVHTGSNETAYDNSELSVQTANVNIVDHNGRYILAGGSDSNEGSGHSTSDTFVPRYSDRSNYSIFFSPNYPIESTGYYHWHCGGTFNFQWFRNKDTHLKVADGAHVKMSASTIVLTIGPQVTSRNVTNPSDPYVKVSKRMIGSSNSSWELYGVDGLANATSYPKLHVMSQIEVNYTQPDSDTHVDYTIEPGTYINVPRGVNLFSKDGENYFRYTSEIRSLENEAVVIKPSYAIPTSPEQPTTPATQAPTTDGPSTSDAAFTSVTTNSSVMPARVGTNTLSALSLFNRTRNAVALSPMDMETLTVRNTPDRTTTLYEADIIRYGTVVVDYEMNSVYYKDGDTDENIHNIPIVGTFKIQKRLSDSEVADIIEFKGEPGRVFQIPAPGASEDKIDLFDPEDLKWRITNMPGGNYVCDDSAPEEIRIVKKYY